MFCFRDTTLLVTFRGMVLLTLSRTINVTIWIMVQLMHVIRKFTSVLSVLYLHTL